MPLPEPPYGSQSPYRSQSSEDSAPPPFASHEDRPVGVETTGAGGRRSRWLIAGAAGVVLLALTGVTALLVGHLGQTTPTAGPGPSARPSRSTRMYSCIQLANPGMARDDGYCGRMVDDTMRRTELTEADRTRLAADLRKLQQAMSFASMCSDSIPGMPPSARMPQCDGVPRLGPRDGSGSSGDRQPDSMDARAVRLSFDRAGFPGSTVRIAAGNDPAPRGSIVFGVPVSDACFVGFVYSLRGGGSSNLSGRLPDGGCLSG